MESILRNFGGQFTYEPEAEGGRLPKSGRFIVAGMGGSNLTTGFLKMTRPELRISAHRDYGLPDLAEEELRESLIISSSYSGNTEEAIDAFLEAGKKGLGRVVVSAGGKLLELARKEGAPYIRLPDTGIQPRLAAGYSFRALQKAVGDEEGLRESAKLKDLLDLAEYERVGRALGEKLKGFVPVVYSSAANGALAYVWKIIFNETGKIPAFSNVLPELNHNEMTGFDVKESTAPLSEKFSFIFLKDDDDDSRIQKRMEILERFYRQRNLKIEVVKLGGSPYLKIFSSFLVANWTAYCLAEYYGVEPEAVPMVEEFKKLIG